MACDINNSRNVESSQVALFSCDHKSRVINHECDVAEGSNIRGQGHVYFISVDGCRYPRKHNHGLRSFRKRHSLNAAQFTSASVTAALIVRKQPIAA